MKKLLSIIIMCVFCLSLAGCQKAPKNASAEDANQYLTDFFSSYGKMNEYLKNRDIAISAFSLDGNGLSSVLRAVYQAEAVTYTFPLPSEIQEDVFIATVDVSAPNIHPLYEMYSIDREFSDGNIPKDFVAQSFYDNIRSGTTWDITTTVTVTLRYDNHSRKWSVDPSNDLAFAIFPNIDKM